MKTIVKLLIAAAVLHATVRGGLAAWDYYQLKDQAQQLVIFGARASTAQLETEIIAKAEALGVELRPEDVRVDREGSRTIARASYIQAVELLPRYEYPVSLSFEVEGISMTTTGDDGFIPAPR